MANDAAVIALDSVFIGSPAQLHVLKLDDVCGWDDAAAPAPNAAIDKRLCLNLVPRDAFPDQSSAYDDEHSVWRTWSEQRRIQRIEGIDGGVAYFMEKATSFHIIRCDERDDIDSDAFSECLELNEGVFRHVDSSGSDYPDAVEAVRREIKLDAAAKLKELYVSQRMILVLDDKWRLGIFTDTGEFVRRIRIDGGEAWVEPERFELAFDGQRVWVILNGERMYFVSPQAPTDY